MAADDLLVFPSHVKVTPIEELKLEMRNQMNWHDGDVVITKLNSRTTSRVLSSDMMSFLKEFNEPAKFTDAIINFSRTNSVDPYELLERTFPIISQLKEDGLLVVAGSNSQQEIIACYKAGDNIGKYLVIQAIQVLDDSEVYKVLYNNTYYALKIVRDPDIKEMNFQLQNEASILTKLDTPYTPKLIDINYFNHKSYVIVEWIEGDPIIKFIQNLVMKSGKELYQKISVCCEMLRAFQAIHNSGVIHSDIHPKNILVTPERGIKIIDFGLAHDLSQEPSSLNRGGVPYFFEPEYAESCVNKKKPPLATLLGEQYSIAALIYLCLTGKYYLDFSLEKEKALNQIINESPLPFTYWNVEPYPELEAIIKKALSKRPMDRFASLDSFIDSLYHLTGSPISKLPPAVPFQRKLLTHNPIKRLSAEYFKNTLKKYDFSSDLLCKGLTSAPTCSISFGDAGVAYFFYRSAVVLNNAEFLSLADIWINNAKSKLSNPNAFYSDYLKITKENIHTVSLFHHASGIYCVEALITSSLGDHNSTQLAIEKYIGSCSDLCSQMDLTTGKSGILLGAANIIEAVQSNKYIETKPLRDFCDNVCDEIIYTLHEESLLTRPKSINYLGMAHGLAGILYGVMRWSKATGRELDNIIALKLNDLFLLADKDLNNSMSWRRSLDESITWPGWCHGSAGYIHLWALADEIYQGKCYLQVAEQAGSHTLHNIEKSSVNLCCGTSGQVFGLLCLYKNTQKKIWLNKAFDLAKITYNSAGSNLLIPNSLMKGNLGLALLGVELTNPLYASMPLFE